MATLKAIKKLATQWQQARVSPKTPKLGKKSTAKPVSNFYGQPIAKGKLHSKLGIKQGTKIPLAVIEAKIAKLKKIKKKTPAELKTERELVFALNAKTKFGKK